MGYYIICFSKKLEETSRDLIKFLMELKAIELWEGAWIVNLEQTPERVVHNLLEVGGSVTIPIVSPDLSINIDRGVANGTREMFYNDIFPILCSINHHSDYVTRLIYCNSGEKYFEFVLSRFIQSRSDGRGPTELCKFMLNEGSDKGLGWHNYTEFYDVLFNDTRNDVSAVLEVGIGTNYTDIPSSMGRYGVPGASLRGWRNYFPNAKIFGADVDRRILINEANIESFYVDQLEPTSFDLAWANMPNTKFDIIIDDGLHTLEASVNSLKATIERLVNGGYYVIEDVPVHLADQYVNAISSFEMPMVLLELFNSINKQDNCLIILKNVAK